MLRRTRGFPYRQRWPNKELETTNEDLQSDNDELETTNKELQSANAELQTVNQELRERADDLERANAFLESVLASLRAAVVVVNQDMDVLVWNQRSEALWGLRAGEVKNRSLLSLGMGAPFTELLPAIRQCIDGESDLREVVVAAMNHGGKPFQCRMSCTPLVVGKNRQGAILIMDELPAEG